ncbi:MAG: hypothetical protein ACLFQM_11080 [Fidelibacterota bacterium]
MKKVLVSIFLITIFVCNGYSQNYQIQDFLPDSLTTWQMYGSGEVGGSHRNEDIKDEKDFYSTNYSISPIVRFKFKRIKQNSDLSVNAYSSFDYDEQKNSKKTNVDSWNWNIKESINLNYDHYLGEKIGLSANGRMSYQFKKSEETERDVSYGRINGDRLIRKSDDKRKQNQSGYNMQIAPGIVYGRIYDGQYAAKAAEIIDALKSEGLLSRALTKAEFQQLSQIILERKAVYHYDSRIKKLEALNEIMAYLKSINVVDSNNHQAAFILQDLYAYELIGEEDNRKFGLKFYGNINYTTNKNDYEADIIHDITDSLYNDSNGSLAVEELYTIEDNHETMFDYSSYGISLGFHHAIIQNWNLYFNYGLNYHYSVYDNNHNQEMESITRYTFPPDDDYYYFNEYKFDSETKRHRINLNGTIFYKFSSRSIAKLYSSINYIKLEEEEDFWHRTTDKSENSISLTLKPQFKYYITPKFYLSTNVNFRLFKYNYENESITGVAEPNSYKQESLETATSASISLGYYL